MGDSWEDEEFTVPSFAEPVTTTAAAPAVWDDEEETVEEPVKPVTGPTVNEAAKRREEQEMAKLESKLKYAELEKETAEQRRVRERKQVEEADHELSNELFSGKKEAPKTVSLSSSSSSSRPDLTTLKNIKDHQQYATTVANKFTVSNSTSFNIGAFYSRLTNELKGKLPVETLEEAIEALKNELENKKSATKKQPPKKSKKQLEMEARKHGDVFGEAEEDGDRYDNYSSIEDSFM